MTGRSREQALEEYRELHEQQELGASQYQWRKGDILLEECGQPQFQNGGDRRSAKFDENLKKFIDDSDTGESYKTAVNYRYVSWAFSGSARILKVPWSCYRIVARRDDREELLARFVAECEREDAGRKKGVRYLSRRMEKIAGWTPTPLISEEDRVPEVERGLRDMTPEQRVAVVQDIVAEDRHLATAALREIAASQPDAVKEALKDKPTRQAVQQAVWDTYQPSRDEFGTLDPILRSIDEKQALTELQVAADEFAKRIDDIMPRLGEIPERDRDPLARKRFLIGAFERAQQAIDRVRTFIDNGKTDLDQFLGGVLGANRG